MACNNLYIIQRAIKGQKQQQGPTIARHEHGDWMCYKPVFNLGTKTVTNLYFWDNDDWFYLILCVCVFSTFRDVRVCVYSTESSKYLLNN